MLDVIASVRKEVNFDALGMRVGIHTVINFYNLNFLF